LGDKNYEELRELKPLLKNPLFWVACFAFLNVIMYITIAKFWIGGSSFLPMIGEFGVDNKFLFAFIVNLGIIAGSLISALGSKEFVFRIPKNSNNVIKAVVGGILIGMGVTLAPGTCSTVFITGMPMLSVNSFLSAAGIFIGAYISYRLVIGREK
jgi:sulfur transporter